MTDAIRTLLLLAAVVLAAFAAGAWAVMGDIAWRAPAVIAATLIGAALFTALVEPREP
jgi:hypothetical protein